MPDVIVTPSVQSVTVTPNVQGLVVSNGSLTVNQSLDTSSFQMFTDGHTVGTFNTLLGTASGTGTATFANDYQVVSGSSPVVGIASIVTTANEQYSRAAICDRQSLNASSSPSIHWDQGTATWRARVKRLSSTNSAHRFECGFFFNHNYNAATSPDPDSAPSISTNFCWYNRGTDNWKILVSDEDGSAPVYTSTSVTAGEWHVLEVVISSDYNSVEFFADGSLVASITRASLGVNFPAEAAAMYAGCSVRNCPELDGLGDPLPVSAGTLQIDYMTLNYQIGRS